MEKVRALLSGAATYLKRSASEASRWFRVGKTLWAWSGLAIVVLFAFYVAPGQLPDRVRWAGTLFEFMGVGAVVIGISRARRAFGRPSILRGIAIWLSEFRFVFFRRPPINLSANMVMGVGTSVSIGTVVARAARSVEERLAQLEKQTTELQTSVGNISQKVDQQKRELLAELAKEAAERQAGDQGVSKKLEEGMVGDSPFEIAGTVYVCLGLLMAHLSEEIAALLFKSFGLT